MREGKSGEVRPGQRERETESTKLFGTTKQFAAFFLSFFIKESNTALNVFTPLFPKVQTFAEFIFFMTLIVITS